MADRGAGGERGGAWILYVGSAAQAENAKNGEARGSFTVPCKVTGKCGSVTVRTVPAPRGAGIVAARVPKKVLQFAGIEDFFYSTSSRGSTKTLGNFVKATSDCLLKTYGFLTPDFWTETRFIKSPFQEFTDLLAKPTKAHVLEDVEA